jgi:hypothetical protein
MDFTPNGVTKNGVLVPFATVLGQNHYVEIYCQIEDWQGNVLSWQFGIEGGDVTIDRTSQIRRSCKITVTPFGAAGVITDPAVLVQLSETLIPQNGKDIFAPYGNKVRLWYGIRIPGYVNATMGNDIATWSLGVMRLSAADISDDGTPTMAITAYDDSRTISRNRLTKPWIVAAGTNWGDAITALFADRLPGMVAKPHSITSVTAVQLVVDPESDPWKTGSDWAASIGQEVYFDRDGQLTITPEPDPENDPVVWIYDDGTTNPNAVLLSLGRGMSDDPGYNGIVLTSESNTLDIPVRVEIWDDDSDSPTFALGPYGKVPKFVSNPYVTDPTQGGAAAYAELLKTVGGTETLSFAIVPNPAHEAGDLVRVVRPKSRTDVIAIIDSMTIPLAVTDPMTIRTRERRSAVQITGGLL